MKSQLPCFFCWVNDKGVESGASCATTYHVVVPSAASVTEYPCALRDVRAPICTIDCPDAATTEIVFEFASVFVTVIICPLFAAVGSVILYGVALALLAKINRSELRAV